MRRQSIESNPMSSLPLVVKLGDTLNESGIEYEYNTFQCINTLLSSLKPYFLCQHEAKIYKRQILYISKYIYKTHHEYI